MKTGQRIKNFIRNNRLYLPIRAIREKKEALDWERRGRVGSPPNLIKQKIVREYGKLFGINTLVETGTYFGDMVFAVKDDFREIFSVELDNDLFEAAKKKFVGCPHVHIIKGDSSKVLQGILSQVKGPCLFWLDAHYSGGITAKGDLETPILKELEAILSDFPEGSAILIDDARCFVGGNDYPTLGRLRDYILKRCPDYVFEVKQDIIRIFPRYEQ